MSPGEWGRQSRERPVRGRAVLDVTRPCENGPAPQKTCHHLIQEGGQAPGNGFSQILDSLDERSARKERDVVREANGIDRSCEATIYPVLDKPHTTGAFQDRRKIEALLRSASFFM